MATNKDWMKEQIEMKLKEKILETENYWDDYMSHEITSSNSQTCFLKYKELQAEVYYLARHLFAI